MKDEHNTKKQLISKLVDLRQRIEELSKSVEIYRNIFENTGAATIVFGEDMTISMLNREAEKLSGYSKEEVVGKKKWIDFVAENELDRMKEYHRLRNIEPDVVPKSYEFRFRDRDGNLKDILLTVDMIRGGKERVATLLDITKRKEAVEALRQKTEDVKKRMEDLEKLYGTPG